MKTTLKHKIIEVEKKALEDMLTIAVECQLITGRPLKLAGMTKKDIDYSLKQLEENSLINPTSSLLIEQLVKHSSAKNNFQSFNEFKRWVVYKLDRNTHLWGVRL